MSTTRVAESLERLQRRALAVGIVGSLLLVVGYATDPTRFFQAYLIGFLFWLAPALGSLAVVMLHNLTGGAWGFAIRRLLEAGIRNIVLMAVLFVPILVLGVPRLYEWSHADVVAADEVLRHKALYLNRTFFSVRAIVFFATWLFLAFAMIRLAARYDRRLDIGALRRLKLVSGLGLAAYVLTMSFASFDWGMSLEPHWFSTIYGVLFVIGQVLSTFCLAIVAAARLSRFEPFSRWYQRSHFHDLGNLTLAFVLLWAYVSFSQFLIIWSGNLPEETPWYLNRLGAGWQAIALVLVVFHFAVPFGVLLTRRVKRSATALAGLVAALFLIRFLDLYWLLAPAYHHGEMHVSWMDVVAPVAVGGLWLGFFARNLRGRPLVSLQDAHLLGELEEAPVS